MKAVAHLYSGGADSSLAACLLAESFDEVCLNTFTRFGFVASGFSSVHVGRIKERFPRVRFVHRFIPAGGLYEEVESHRFYPSLGKYGVLVLDTCGHCKVALHWRNLLFCLEHGITYASDGAAMGAEEFAEQNPRILMRELEAFYAHFGVTLLHPAYQEGLSTEEALYDLGVTDQKNIKRTTRDMQVVCTQQILFAMMMRVYLSRHTFGEYEAQARAYLVEKLDHLKRLTEEHLEHPGPETRVARLLR